MNIKKIRFYWGKKIPFQVFGSFQSVLFSDASFMG